jgi:hypothetical protein
MERKIKEKQCKYCLKSFLPSQPLQNTCNYSHFVKYQEQKAKEKKKIAREKKKVSISALTIKADKILSEYTRKRDCIKTSGSIEKGVCITC